MIVDLFLREKGVNVKPLERKIDITTMKNRTEKMMRKNPQGGLPFFELPDGTAIAETIAMCEYGEEKIPNPPMVGQTSEERALTRMWQRRMEEFCKFGSLHEFRVLF